MTAISSQSHVTASSFYSWREDPQEKVPRPEVNTPLLRKALEHITAHPEEWKQSFWASNDLREGPLRRPAIDSCGTAYCLAGHAVLLAGYEFVWESPDMAANVALPGELAADAVFAGHKAQELLGLTRYEAERLFHSDNSLADLWAMSNAITHGDIEIPQEFQ
jgi:hypothetical protein